MNDESAMKKEPETASASDGFEPAAKLRDAPNRPSPPIEAIGTARSQPILELAPKPSARPSGAPMQPRKSADPLSNIPKAGQELLERFFGGGALIFGTAFIISGLAVAVEAFAKVLGKPLPTALEELVVQFLYPSLTPSILILFFFSISLGILKQLQLSSESTGVLYTEDD